MAKAFFEDLELDETARLGGYPLSEREIIEFAREYDPLPLHVDPVFAKTTPFGSIIASGFHLMAICQKLSIENRPTAYIAGLELDEVRFLSPGRPGDVLTLELENLAKRESGSNPQAGIVTQRFSLLNQANKTLLTYRGIALVEKRQGHRQERLRQ